MQDKWSQTYGDELCEPFTMTEAELETIATRAAEDSDAMMLLAEIRVLRRACYFYSVKAKRGRRKTGEIKTPPS